MTCTRRKGKTFRTVVRREGERYRARCRTGPGTDWREPLGRPTGWTFRIEITKRKQRRKLVEYIDEYMNSPGSTKRPATAELYRLSLRELDDFTGDIELDSITKQKVEYFESALMQNYSSTKVDVIIWSLGAAFARAKVQGYIKGNPFQKGGQLIQNEYEEKGEMEHGISEEERQELLRHVLLPGAKV